MSEWYYARNNQQRGPVSAADLRAMAASGDLRPGDLVWQEGMTQWQPASSRGLFPGGPTYPDAPTARPRDAERDRIRANRRDDDFADDFEDGFSLGRPTHARRRLSTGAKVGIIVGSVVGALVLVGLLLTLLLVNSSSSTGGFTVSLRAHETRNEFVEFRANTEAVITIRSDVTAPGADVDLYVFDMSTGQQVAWDDGPDKDCHVRFRVVRGGRYRLEIHNLGPGDARCNITHNGIRK